MLNLARKKLQGRKTIAVMSAKGGVGKSVVSSLLAIALSREYNTLLIDLDIHTMALPKLFGYEGSLHEVRKEGIVPFTINEKLKLLTLGGVVRNKTVILPGRNQEKVMESLLGTGAINEELVIFDLPPGLGDEILVLEKVTDFLPVVVTNPSELSVKVVKYLLDYLAELGKDPLLVANMSYIKCGSQIIRPFGNLSLHGMGRKQPQIIELPMDETLNEFIGKIHEYKGELLDGINKLSIMINERMHQT
ncbi:ATP-binding protein [Metallosphaera sedula]|uniref:ATP-binding protein n=1 Tax=Metallosphaera sedula TaxID=43687 RepID=A0A0K1SKH3_9CREN|nr:ATP-binding protein [Metallosphaera sedula]AKV77544.1 ATP-binding protein [Metallosphaera sedula]AKV79789.1 ATP-binding protein [Metallosphaera sedula]AKV82034.1 ATP-binding protein [Metallosphaera sedula]AKV84273.1 ATP-binding protein [Metallosphaera sedula]